MAILLKVQWVDQSAEAGPYSRIMHIGGASNKLQWKHSHAQAIESIERDSFAYYVEKDARALELNVACTPDGKKYLTIGGSDEASRLLLSLPSFPPLNTASL
jgi:hypothetical protein